MTLALLMPFLCTNVQASLQMVLEGINEPAKPVAVSPEAQTIPLESTPSSPSNVPQESKIAREISRVGDQLDREIPRIQNQVERESTRIADQLDREAPQVIATVERETERVVGQVSNIFRKFKF